MHRTKESLQNPATKGNEQMKEAHEAAVEEAYEAAGGATSTDGVGTGFDAGSGGASHAEKAQSSADGPASGEMTDPPTSLKAKKKQKRKGVQRFDNASNHAAENSSKAY